MRKKERIAELEKQVADLRWTVKWLQWEIDSLKNPPPVTYPTYPYPSWPITQPTWVSDRTSTGPDALDMTLYGDKINGHERV